VRAVRALRAAAAAVAILPCLSCGRKAIPATQPPDPKAAEAIRGEVRAFYRDLALQDWPTLLTHFWPAKITARWEPPFPSREKSLPTLSAAAIGGGLPAVAEGCARGDAAVARSEIGIAGRWARLSVARCPGSPDELWLLDVNGSWKIVRLVLGNDGR
jgi:hypothetical protein